MRKSDVATAGNAHSSGAGVQAKSSGSFTGGRRKLQRPLATLPWLAV